MHEVEEEAEKSTVFTEKHTNFLMPLLLLLITLNERNRI